MALDTLLHFGLDRCPRASCWLKEKLIEGVLNGTAKKCCFKLYGGGAGVKDKKKIKNFLFVLLGVIEKRRPLDEDFDRIPTEFGDCRKFRVQNAFHPEREANLTNKLADLA